ncbi:MAG TPA: SDR family oxidoreductase [Spirochaetia bacterium]|nr:SDR family oxidoreductase [Spirochaetia bacterium]
MDLGLQEKVAIVTGGGTGIGAGICEALAQEGVNVAVNWIVGKEDVEKFAAGLSKKYGTDCRPFYADVSRADDLDAMVRDVIAAYGHIDILVNNAGIWPTENILDMPDGNWQKVININLNGPFMLCKRVAKHMVDAGIKGSIINLSSKSGITYNTGGHAHYASAKAGINMMTRTLARELLPHGIRANAIAPGMVRTPINEDKWTDPDLKKAYEARIPVGRFAMPVEIGYLVAFLASEKSFNIVGTVIDVTGGMLI